MTQRLSVRLVSTTLLCAGALLFAGCGDDPVTPVDDQEATDVEPMGEGEDEPEDGDVEAITIKSDPLVRPEENAVPRIKPPPGVTIKQDPTATDTVRERRLPEGPVDPDAASAKMFKLHQVVSTTIPRFDRAGRDPTDPQMLDELKRYREAVTVRDDGLAVLDNLGRRYLETVGDGADPSLRFIYGYALSVRADRSGADAGAEMRRVAGENLAAYLAAPDDQGEFVADAESLLGMNLLKLGESRGASVDDAVDHLTAATGLFLDADRKDDAAMTARSALSALIDRGREKDAAELARRLELASQDFGVRTRHVQRLVRRAALYPGATMAEFDGLLDAEGNVLSVAALRGKPAIIHLFRTANLGRRLKVRDVETVLVPLSEEFGPKGLQMVGVSLDYALPDEHLTQIKANWEEWGTPGDLHDGSLEDVREWCNGIGMDWPFHYDGKWTENAVAVQLGVSQAYAFLLDADGVIRWRGAPPYAGLAAAVAELTK